MYLFFLDIGTKYIAQKKLITPLSEVNQAEVNQARVFTLIPENIKYFHTDIAVIPGYFTLTYIRNFDLGFSLFTNLNLLSSLSKEKLSMVVLAIQGVAILFIFYFFSKGSSHFLAFIFILAGGMGNILNRLFLGYVVDFIQLSVPITPFYWPVFNLADIFITIGAIIFIFETEKKKPSKDIEKIEASHN